MTKQQLMIPIEDEATRNGHELAYIWTKSRWGFHNNCRQCGAFVAITVSRGAIREGELLKIPCNPLIYREHL